MATQAIPGTVVPTGAQVSTAGGFGAQGGTGPQGPTGPVGGIGPVQLLSTAYNLSAGDTGKYLICSGGSWALGLPAPAAGLNYRVRNNQGISGTTGTITITPVSGTIDGLASLPLLAGQDLTILTDGTNWYSFGRHRRVVLGTQDISANGTILLPPGYSSYKMVITDLVGSAIGASIAGRISIDGSTFLSSALYYTQSNYNNAATTVISYSSGALAYFFASAGLYNSRQLPGMSDLTIYPGDANNSFTLVGLSMGASSAYQVIWSFGSYYNSVVGRVLAINLFGNGGSITSGMLALEGVV